MVRILVDVDSHAMLVQVDVVLVGPLPDPCRHKADVTDVSFPLCGYTGSLCQSCRDSASGRHRGRRSVGRLRRRWVHDAVPPSLELSHDCVDSHSNAAPLSYSIDTRRCVDAMHKVISLEELRLLC